VRERLICIFFTEHTHIMLNRNTLNKSWLTCLAFIYIVPIPIPYWFTLS